MSQMKPSDDTNRETWWRGLDELAVSSDGVDAAPSDGTAESDPFTRRRFLQLMGASVALASGAGCIRQPQEKLVPYIDRPEHVVPGKPSYYASAMPFDGYGLGVLVESHTGRPTKVEGNPLHPAVSGGSSPFMQASVLTLYDPKRSKIIRNRDQPATEDGLERELVRAKTEAEKNQGQDLAILTGPMTSPTFLAQVAGLKERFPKMEWYEHAPLSNAYALRGARLAFGEDVRPVFDFEQADVIVCFDCDFLYAHPYAVRYAGEFASRRKLVESLPGMNRLYAFEPMPTVTGAAADHPFALRNDELPKALLQLYRALKGTGSIEKVGKVEPKDFRAIAKDLEQAGQRGLVIAGDRLPAEAHHLVHAMNERLGNQGSTVRYIPARAPGSPAPSDFPQLVRRMHEGKIRTLLQLAVDPAYTAFADLGYSKALPKVPRSIHLGLYHNATAAKSTWHVPESHFLEDWGDVRSYDGTASIIQPLIRPLYPSRAAPELLGLLQGRHKHAYDIVRDYWRSRLPEPFEPNWRRALHDGVIPGTAAASRRVSLEDEPDYDFTIADKSVVEVGFLPDPRAWDGSFTENAWLQELPKPITKLVWDNAAYLAPHTAEKRKIENGRNLRLTLDGRTIEAAAWIVPGHAENSVTLTFGYGKANSNGDWEAGYNAYALRSTEAPWSSLGLTLVPTETTARLVTTQHHDRQEGTHHLREGSLDTYKRNPAFARKPEHEKQDSFFPGHPKGSHKWGMAIDLGSCIGCGACTIACQAENNIPVVGKNEVARNREMHWIRVDRYFIGPKDEPRIAHQPVPCMHCENAPCEVVCPVAATVHDSSGLNEMIYNRCIGTRYCSNNCPYKVRRFNFFDWAGFPDPMKFQQNPDVTVRSRGVMEKCTYCVQRIKAAQHDADGERRGLRTDEVQTACQQACPTQAIEFGDLNDPRSRVSRLKKSPLNYTMLTELNTAPRTSYLAAVRNENKNV